MLNFKHQLFFSKERIVFVGTPPPMSVHIPLRSLVLSLDGNPLDLVVQHRPIAQHNLLSLLIGQNCRFMVRNSRPLLYIMLDPLNLDYEALRPKLVENKNGLTSLSNDLDLLNKIKGAFCSQGTFDAPDPNMFFHDLIHEERSKECNQTRIDSRVYGALKMIEENIEKNLNQRDVAASVHLSHSRLSSLFKETTGMSFQTYRQLQRSYQVIRLRSKGYSFTQASTIAGFHDSPHFTRTFKKFFDISPAYIGKNYDVSEVKSTHKPK